MPDGTGAVMIDGKMQDDATWKQAKVLVDLARLVAAKDPEMASGTGYERPVIAPMNSCSVLPAAPCHNPCRCIGRRTPAGTLPDGHSHEQDSERQISDRPGGPAPAVSVPRRGLRHRSDLQQHRGMVQAIPAEVRPHKDQPFYHLFAENDETEYIAYVSEQNLLPDTAASRCVTRRSRKSSSRTATAAIARGNRPRTDCNAA